MPVQNVSGLHLPGIAANITFMSQCTPALCDLQKYGTLKYLPSGTGNLIFAGIFAILGIYHMACWPIWKTHSFSLFMFMGMVLEVMGYLGRIDMRRHMFISGPFLLYVFSA